MLIFLSHNPIYNFFFAFLFVLETHMQNLIMYRDNKVIPFTFSVYSSFFTFFDTQVIALSKHMLYCCSHCKRLWKRSRKRILMSFTILFDFFSFYVLIQNCKSVCPPQRRCLYIIGITILAASNGISFFLEHFPSIENLLSRILLFMFTFNALVATTA